MGQILYYRPPSKKIIVVKGSSFKIMENGLTIKSVNTDDPLKLVEEYKKYFIACNTEKLPRVCEASSDISASTRYDTQKKN